MMHDKACDITLIMPPMWSTTVPWTGPAFLCESLRQRGFKVQFLDYNIQLFRLCERLGFAQHWEEPAFFNAWTRGDFDYLSYLVDLEEIQGSVIAFSTTMTSLRSAGVLAERIRNRFPRRKIVFGGHGVHVLDLTNRVPSGAVDAICSGEGEDLICEVMEKGFGRLQEVAGLYLPTEHGWKLNRERPFVADLDTIPWPRYSEVDHSLYTKQYLGLVGSRGCLGKCVFCSERHMFPGHRSRSAINQVDELEYLSSHFRVEHFPYYDALHNGDYAILREKSEEIIRRGLKVDYSGNMVVRPSMPDELLSLMRKSGFSVAFIGIESGSAATLAGMRKRHNPAMASEFLRKCHNAGIRTEVNFIVGFPTETETHFEETLEFVRKNRRHIDAILNVNTFALAFSDLFDLRDAYGVEGRDMHHWRTRGHENDFGVRRVRMRRLLELQDELGLRGDVLISNDYDLRNTSGPVLSVFLDALGQLAASSTPEEGTMIRSVADRLLLALRLRRPTPLEMAGKLVENVRERGMRQTFKRGCEWLYLQAMPRKG